MLFRSIMKKSIYLFFILFIFMSCDSKSSGAGSDSSSIPKTYVEVLFFQTRQKCNECTEIKRLTNEVLNNDFSKQMKNGDITYQRIDLGTSGGEQMAKKMGIVGTSLFINLHKDGKVQRNNITEYAFATAKKDSTEFKIDIKKKITSLLNEK